METQIAIFKQKSIRKIVYKNEWWFSVVDVVEALTDSNDPKQYVKKMRIRDKELGSNWGTICTPVEMLSADGKRREIMAATTEGLFRIIQSIPSPKAEPLLSMFLLSFPPLLLSFPPFLSFSPLLLSFSRKRESRIEMSYV